VIAFAPLRALGWRPPVEPPPKPARLSDPAGDAITAHLIAMKLWRMDCDLSLERDGDRLTVRLFLPQHSQADREIGGVEALRVRTAVSQALTFSGHAVRFADSYPQERGHRGWNVLVKAKPNPHA
jgi:hypothetical protein